MIEAVLEVVLYLVLVGWSLSVDQLGQQLGLQGWLLVVWKILAGNHRAQLAIFVGIQHAGVRMYYNLVTLQQSDCFEFPVHAVQLWDFCSVFVEDAGRNMSRLLNQGVVSVNCFDHVVALP